MQQMLLVQVVYSKQCQVGVQLQQLMIKSRQHTMHIAHKVYQLGVIKKIGLQICKPIFLMLRGYQVEIDKYNPVSKGVILQDFQNPK